MDCLRALLAEYNRIGHPPRPSPDGYDLIATMTDPYITILSATGEQKQLIGVRKQDKAATGVAIIAHRG
jgi:hypothetical protein